MKYFAPAKVNLYLEIVGKRKDGYHLVETVLQTVNLYDEIEIVPSLQGVKLTCDSPIKKSDNLVYHAVQSLQKYNKKNKGVCILLKKNIPLGSGLGGGASDAACVLKVLNRLWELNLPEDKIFDIAKSLGADVPFFLHGGYAYAHGIGEKISPYPLLSDYWLILVNPGFSLSSKEIYTRFNNLKSERKANLAGITNRKTFWKNVSTAKDIAKNLYNRLEDVVLPEYPEIAKIKKLLVSLGALGSLMSGSGSTVFAIVESEKKGKEILTTLKKYRWQTWLVRTAGRCI